jgi:NADH-quinone oxidoreductase subunit A
MLAEYSGVLLILVIGLTVAIGMLALHQLLSPKREFASKLDPFECGETQIVSPRQRFSVKFYMVAMLFILFDVEAVFLYPWRRSSSTPGARSSSSWVGSASSR